MIVFFIILGILFFISLILFMICLSNLEIEIKGLKLDTTNIKYKKLEDYLIYIRLKLLDKFTWIKIKINHKKIKKLRKTSLIKLSLFRKISNFYTMENTILENRKEIFTKENLRYFKDLKITIKKLDLYLKISTGFPNLTVYAVAVISSIISIILAKTIKDYSKDKYKYIVFPMYELKPAIKISLNCIINVKMVHIINIIYMLKKKRSVRNDERTSDRRAYVCSND